MILLAPTERFFCLPRGEDQVAMAYRMFDHWTKHDHRDCLHDSILECIEEYTGCGARP